MSRSGYSDDVENWQLIRWRGQVASADYPTMTFEVHNVDCYPTTLPGAVQHNAWRDAMALREKLRPTTKGETE